MSKTTKTSKNNIFSIDDPNSYFCHVVDFTLGHRILDIKIQRPDKSEFFLAQFLFVQYFSGPMHWQGADFHIEAAEPFMEIQEGLKDPSDPRHELDQTILDKMMDTWHLYVVAPLDKSFQVKIFSSSVHFEIRKE